MATHEISKDQWKPFLETLSERRKGAKVTVEVADPHHGPRKEVTDLPLVGISYEDKGSETGSVELLLGDAAGDHVTRVISHPKTIYHKSAAGVLSDEVNHDEIVEITSSDDPPVTQLHFKG